MTEAAVTRRKKAGVLNPYRGAMAFEAMRLHVDRSGKTPKAFMLTAGHLAMARARAPLGSLSSGAEPCSCAGAASGSRSGGRRTMSTAP